MEGEGVRSDIERLTREGLAEGCLLAAEAREAIRSRYEDWMLAIVLAGLLLWGSLLLLIAISGAIAAGAWMVLASLLTVVALCAPLFLVCRSRFRKKLDEQDRWLDRLSRPRDDDNAVSNFDLLLDVAHQVPAWLSMREKNRSRNHPFLTAAAFLSVVSVVIISVQALAHRGDSSLPYLLAMLVPFLVLLIAASLAGWRAVRRERESAIARWREREESSRHALEEILGGP